MARARSRAKIRRSADAAISSTTARAISPAPRRCSTDARPSPQSPRHRARRRLRARRCRDRRRHAAFPRGSIGAAGPRLRILRQQSIRSPDELQRCQALGLAAKDDAACEAAWAENRRRFFTYQPPSDAHNGRRRQQPSLPAGKRHGRHRRHRQFPRHLHPIHRFRLRPGARRCALARRRPHRHRHHARRPLLGDGAGRGRARAPDQEDALYRRLRLHHRQLQQPRADHLQLLRRPRHRGRRRHAERRAAPSAGQDRPGRHRRRQADPRPPSPA